MHMSTSYNSSGKDWSTVKFLNLANPNRMSFSEYQNVPFMYSVNKSLSIYILAKLLQCEFNIANKFN